MLEITSPSNKVRMSILLTAIACMLITSSQFPSASAGYCIDDDNDTYYAQDCGRAIDCDDNDAEKYPGHGCIDDVLQDIDDVSTALQNLIIGSEGFDINSAQVQSLLTKLQQASAKVDSGNITSAIGKLNSFINQINAFYNSGQISSYNRDLLIDPVMDILDYLQ